MPLISPAPQRSPKLRRSGGWLRRAALSGLVLSLAVSAAAGAATRIRPPSAVTARALAPMSLLSGPDVSSNNHFGRSTIGWGRVSANGRAFAIIKSTGEHGYTNPWFRRDWTGAGAAGLDRAAYHFAIPTTRRGDALKQATAFVRTVSSAGGLHDAGTLPLVLDLEQSGGLPPKALQGWVRTFLTTVTALSGRTPIIYTYTDFWKFQMGNSKAFTGYPLWIASYTKRPPSPLPGGWKKWTLWQYTSTGRLSGVPGDVDLSVFDGSYQALTTLADARPLPVLQRWQAAGGIAGSLGAAIGPFTNLVGGSFQDFAGGSIYSSPLGTYIVRGATLARYQASNGPNSLLGWPTADTTASDPSGAFASLGEVAPTLTPFAYGDLVAAAGGPAYAIPSGPVLDRWTAEGGVDGVLGVPVSDLLPAADGTAIAFTGGQLLDSPTRGLHELTGPILAAWLADGGASSSYGLPSSEIYAVPGGVQAQFGKLTITAAAAA